MRRTGITPLALLILAAACSDDTVPTSPATNEADEQLYQQMIEEIMSRPASQTASPGISLAPSMDPTHLPEGAVQVVMNGGFETGDFTGWSTAATGSAFRPWAVLGDGFRGGFGMDPTDPPEGSYDASHGFDGAGPLDLLLMQEVSLPEGVATLSWQERIQWNFTLGGAPTLPRTHDVEIRDPATDEVLANVRSFSTGTEQPTGDTGWQTFSGDVSAFAGETVLLVFRQHVPEPFRGPGQFEVDDVSLVVEPGSGEIEVDLDIKPGSDENPVNLRSRGVLPVAILTTDDFDAADVDVSTVGLGDGNGAEASVATRGKRGRHGESPHASLEDVDDDGDLDLALKFRTQDLVENGDLHGSTTELFLNGETGDGTPIVGSDGVRALVPGGPPGRPARGRRGR